MIIGLAGRKQSGKNTKSNFIHGYLMVKHGIIDHFEINDEGKLIVPSVFKDSQGNQVKGLGILDLEQENESYWEYASQYIWPYVKQYSFGHALKKLLSDYLGIDPKLFLTDEGKNTTTNLKWENMPGVYTNKKMYKATIEGNPDLEKILVYHEKGNMTVRDLLQFIGTDVFRKMYSTIWLDIIARQIKEEKPQLAIITDCRFPDEAEWIKQKGKTVCLLRNTDSDPSHSSEAIETYDGHDFVLDNRNMSIKESNEQFLEKLQFWGIV